MRFSLRSLLSVVTLCALLCGWVAVLKWQKQQEKKAVAQIRSLGGTVLYDYFKYGVPVQPTGPAFLRRYLGENFFSDVDSLEFAVRLTDAELERIDLAALHKLKSIRIIGSDLTGRAFEYLNVLDNLEFLMLENNRKMDGSGLAKLNHLQGLTLLRLSEMPLTDRHLKSLQRLDRIQRLDLSGTDVTGEFLRWWSPLRNLQDLDLSNTRIIGEYLAHLNGSPQLHCITLPDTDIRVLRLHDLPKLVTLSMGSRWPKELDLAHVPCLELHECVAPPVTRLSGVSKLRDLWVNDDIRELKLDGLDSLERFFADDTPIGDDIVRQLAPCSKLRELHLSRTKITDAGLRWIAGNRKLEELSLNQTRVSDSGLTALSQLKWLRSLELDLTRVTDTGLKHLYSMTSLQKLSVYDTDITPKGVDALKRALPIVDVRFGNDVVPKEVWPWLQ